jgi:hypothetical protein
MTQTRSQTRTLDQETPRSALPRWVYTETVRRIFDVDPDRRLRLVDAPITGPIAAPITGPTTARPPIASGGAVRPTDLWVFQTGPNQLAQVECVREVSRTLVTRMLLYRTAISQAHPQAGLEQYVIVVGDGTVRPLDDPVYTGVYFGLKVLYLRDVEPPWYQASPSFAVLRRCPVPPRYPAILSQADMALGRFLVSIQDPVHEDAVLHDGSERARAGVTEQLVSLYFQGRFGDHPDVPVGQRQESWPFDVTVALAVHAITDFTAVSTN